MKAVDEQAILVVDRGIGWPAHGFHPPRLQKLRRCIEQRIGDRLFMHTLKKSEEPHFIMMLFVMILIHNGPDPSNHLTIPLRKI